MKRLAVLCLLLFATACCGRADEAASPTPTMGSDDSAAQEKKQDPKADPAPQKVTPEGTNAAEGGGGAAEQGKGAETDDDAPAKDELGADDAPAKDELEGTSEEPKRAGDAGARPGGIKAGKPVAPTGVGAGSDKRPPAITPGKKRGKGATKSGAGYREDFGVE